MAHIVTWWWANKNAVTKLTGVVDSLGGMKEGEHIIKLKEESQSQSQKSSGEMNASQMKKIKLKELLEKSAMKWLHVESH